MLSDIEIPQDLLGKPFEIQGRGPDKFDCYGLVMEMNRRQGIIVPEVVTPFDFHEMAVVIAREAEKWRPCEIKPGATLVFNIKGYGSHVGYVLSKTHFLHTWEGTFGVAAERISTWQRRIVGVYEYVA